MKCLARWEELAGGEVSRSVAEVEVCSLAVVSQIPGWFGGSVRDGRQEVEVIGGIWREVEVSGDKVTWAMREVEIEV